MTEEEEGEEISRIAKEATYEAYLRAKNSPYGAVIRRGNQIIRIFADDSYEVLKDSLEPRIHIPVGTKFRIK